MTRARTLICFSLAIGALAALAGCPQTLQQSCPTGTNTVGGFAITFTPVDAGDSCQVTGLPDGGPTDASVAGGPGQTQATLCSSNNPDAGGILFLAIQGQNLRQSGLDDAGNFNFVSGAAQVSGTQCVCAIDIAETLTGTLTPRGGTGAVQFTPDGGLTPVGGLTGSLVDQVTQSDAGTGQTCRCNLPCALRYTASGTAL